MISYPILATSLKAPKSYIIRFAPVENEKNSLIVSLFGGFSKCENTTLLMSELEYKRQPVVREYICVKDIPPYDDGDIVTYHPLDKMLITQYSAKSDCNILFLTTHCNSNCIMCPQSRSNDMGTLYREALQLIDMVETPPDRIILTGGEPTFFKDKFIEILCRLRDKWPKTKVVILTNARTFSNLRFAKQVVTLTQADVEFGIPLYSDSSLVHDEIVGMKRAWSQTIEGLYNLASLKSCIELRVVVMKQNYKRLSKLITFIAHNLPFVDRIVLMGIEPMGKAREIWDSVWVDPLDTADEIDAAVQVAKNHNLTVYLYNQQLCCLPTHLRKYAVSSISDWKRTYIDACNGCPIQHDCGGFFESQNAAPYYSRLFTKQ